MKFTIIEKERRDVTGTFKLRGHEREGGKGKRKYVFRGIENLRYVVRDQRARGEEHDFERGAGVEEDKNINKTFKIKKKMEANKRRTRKLQVLRQKQQD